MPKGWGSPQPGCSPMMMSGVWSFMVPEPAAIPERPGCDRRWLRRQRCLGHAGEIMAAGFETRTGCQHIMRPGNRTPLARLNYFSAQSGDAFSLLVAKASVLTGLVVTL